MDELQFVNQYLTLQCSFLSQWFKSLHISVIDKCSHQNILLALFKSITVHGFQNVFDILFILLLRLFFYGTLTFYSSLHAIMNAIGVTLLIYDIRRFNILLTITYGFIFEIWKLENNFVYSMEIIYPKKKRKDSIHIKYNENFLCVIGVSDWKHFPAKWICINFH